MPKPKKSSSVPSVPGPKPEVLKIEGNWRDAVKKSLTKEETSRRLAEITSDFTMVSSKKRQNQTQWTAQFAVASELCKRGYEVAFTMGNHPVP